MRTRNHDTLTAGPAARRVDRVPELSTLSPEDRNVIALPNTQMARRRVAPFVDMAMPQIMALRGTMPSYVSAAVDGLMAAFGRWAADEQVVLNGK